MSTPAEIIAARVLNAIERKDEVSDYEDSGSFIEETEVTPTATPAPSISDEAAFPTLGGAKKTNYSATTTIWGPDADSDKSSTGTFSKSASPLSSGKFKASTIQEAFSLDAEDQLNVARPEFIKILTSIKKETKTNIECTTSQHTKKRTFLISGKSDDVRLAKRLVIKKLTKPVTISFSIPAQLRSKIIGPQGSTLKPIIKSNEVKIDIGNTNDDSDNTDSDDIFARTVTVTINGDVEGCKHAKTQILSIVKEETKNLTTTLSVAADVKALAESALKNVIKNYEELEFSIPDYKSSSSLITISGDRESVLDAREVIKQKLESFARSIVVQEVPIPKLKHQFLLVDDILNEFDVFIQIPEGDEPVKFIGEKSKIPLAQEKARQTTSQYKVEVLDMSKAHKGNLKHVKAIASLLRSNGSLQTVATQNDISISSPSDDELSKEEISTIPIEIVAKIDQVDNVKNAKKAIVSIVNKISPDSTKVINDIDEFLIPKVPELIKDVAFKNDVSYVILGNYVTLFSNEAEKDDDDFVDSSESSTSFEEVNASLQPLRKMATELENIVLSISPEEQKTISGSNGATLNSILKSVEPNSVVVKFGGDNSNEISIYGLKKQVKVVKYEIDSVLVDYKEFKNNFTTSVDVPKTILSRLIGKNGSNMTSLREEFDVRINVDDDKSSDASARAEITISGIKRNAEECKAQIVSLSKKWADETLARLKIDNQYHRRLIGANGVYINRLQDKYNVKIRFPSENGSNYADAPKSKDEVTIKGSSKGVAKAEEELKELYQFEKENGFQSIIQIPTKAIARVIGKSGETINDIADGTGVEYKFNRDNESEEKLGYAEVTLTGSKSALKEASQKIQEIIDEVENFISISINVDPSHHRSLIGQGGSVMKDIISRAGGDDVPRSKYFRLLTIPNEGSGSDVVTSEGDKAIVEKIIEEVKRIVAEREASIVVDYDIPKEKHRLIVGTAGSIRHSLQEEFKVTIEIPRPHDNSTIVKLRGLPERIEKLTEKLNELTKDDWNVSIDIPQQFHSLVSERGAIFKKLKSDFGVEVSHGNLTRKAAKLSSSSIPEVPESARPFNDEATKFTIDIENDNDEESSELIQWRLKGSNESTEQAAKLIEERLENAKLSNATGWFYSKNPSQFYKIVGSQGSKINQIRKNTNTFITVPRSTDKNPNFIYLVGTEENLKKAQKEIESLI